MWKQLWIYDIPGLPSPKSGVDVSGGATLPPVNMVLITNNIYSRINSLFSILNSLTIAVIINLLYSSMSSESKRFIDKITNMGFRRITVSKAVQRFGTDEKKVCEKNT